MWASAKELRILIKTISAVAMGVIPLQNKEAAEELRYVNTYMLRQKVTGKKDTKIQIVLVKFCRRRKAKGVLDRKFSSKAKAQKLLTGSRRSQIEALLPLGKAMPVILFSLFHRRD